MDRLTLKATIIAKLKVKPNDWGKACNKIQDTAEKVLSKNSWLSYLKASNKDMKISEGCDFVVFNGDFYDWKTFSYKSINIVSSFLEYFNDNDLQLICNSL